MQRLEQLERRRVHSENLGQDGPPESTVLLEDPLSVLTLILRIARCRFRAVFSFSSGTGMTMKCTLFQFRDA